MNFKLNSRPLFTIIFKLRNDNFKTQDFSPLIERVLAGVDGQAYDTWNFKPQISSIFHFDRVSDDRMAYVLGVNINP